VSQSQQDRVLKYIETGKEEGAKVLTGGTANEVIKGGYYIKPTILRGTNDMKVFQEVSAAQQQNTPSTPYLFFSPLSLTAWHARDLRPNDAL
jgi:hypothetical protein